MASAEFAPAVPASERPYIHALDRAATGIGYPVQQRLLLLLLLLISKYLLLSL